VPGSEDTILLTYIYSHV